MKQKYAVRRCSFTDFVFHRNFFAKNYFHEKLKNFVFSLLKDETYPFISGARVRFLLIKRKNTLLVVYYRLNYIFFSFTDVTLLIVRTSIVELDRLQLVHKKEKILYTYQVCLIILLLALESIAPCSPFPHIWYFFFLCFLSLNANSIR